MDNNRLIDIETKIAYQEHTISELNTIVFEQQKTIDELKNQIRILIDRVLDLSENLSQPLGANEKPPHY
jgi:SlyX protein